MENAKIIIFLSVYTNSEFDLYYSLLHGILINIAEHVKLTQNKQQSIYSKRLAYLAEHFEFLPQMD